MAAWTVSGVISTTVTPVEAPLSSAAGSLGRSEDHVDTGDLLLLGLLFFLFRENADEELLVALGLLLIL